MSLKAKFRDDGGFGWVRPCGTFDRLGLQRKVKDSRRKEEKVRNLVDLPYSVFTKNFELEKAGSLTRAEAQKRSLDMIQAMRYQDGNYLWVNDMQPRMVIHPTKPEMNGKDLSDFKDKNGIALFVEAVKTVRGHGSGYISYAWPKPGMDPNQAVPKLSFVKGFEPWGWVIGTGIYIDDVDAAWRENALKATVLTMVSIAVCWRRAHSFLDRSFIACRTLSIASTP